MPEVNTIDMIGLPKDDVSTKEMIGLPVGGAPTMDMIGLPEVAKPSVSKLPTITKPEFAGLPEVSALAGTPGEELGGIAGKMGIKLGVPEQVKANVTDVLKGAAKEVGLEAIATSELAMSLASGMILYLPSKAYGLMALPFGRDVAEIAEQEIAKMGYQPFTKKGKAAAELVGKGFEWFLSPAHNVGEMVSKLSPRLGYVAEFGAELAEFITTGGIVKGLKARFKPSIEQSAKLIDAKKNLEEGAIRTREATVESIPDEVMRKAQEKVLEVQKRQVELEAAEMAKAAAKQDLKVKGERVRAIKQRVEIVPEAAYKVEPKPTEPGKITDYQVEKFIEEHPEIYEGDRIDLRPPKPIEPGKIADVKVPRTKAELELDLTVEEMAKMREEPITELDRQTGVDLPSIEGEKSPFFQSPEEAEGFRKLFEGRKSVTEDIELYTQKLINDTNLAYHAGDEAALKSNRNKLSRLAVEADTFRYLEGEDGAPVFITGVDHMTWSETVSDAAEWARTLRSKIERREDPKLYGGLPIDLAAEKMKRGLTKFIKTLTEEGVEKSAVENVQKGLDLFRTDKEMGAKWIVAHWKTVLDITKKARLDEQILFDASRYVIDRGLTSEGIDLQGRAKALQEGVGKVTPIKLYGGLPIDEIRKSLSRPIPRKTKKVTIDYSKLTPEKARLVKQAEDFHKAFEESKEAKRFKLGRFLDRAKLHTYRAVHERAGILRNDLIKKYGEDGHKIVQYMDAESGSSGHSQRMYSEMRSEALKGVPLELSNAVDAVNLVQRLRDIYGYKTGKEFLPPKGMNPTQTESYHHLIDVFHRLTPEEITKAEVASDIMFDHVKMWIDGMVEVGLKSVEEGKALKAHNYRKLRSINVHDLYDHKYNVKIGDKLVKQTDSGIDVLAKNPIRMIETDSRILYHETANRIYRRIDNQETKLKWRSFDEKFPDNPYIIVRHNDRMLERPERPVPRGWIRDIWFDEGKARTMYFHPDVALQLMSKGSHMSFPLTRFFTNVLGVNLTRFLAVGSSAAWALTRGLTMDVGHTFFSSRRFSQGRWQETDGKRPWNRTYSSFPPKFLGQIGKDMGNTFYDVFTQGEKTGLYMKNGGMMPFLSMREQAFLGRGVKPPSHYAKFLDGISYVSRSMEMWNRVAVMERVLGRRAKEQGITLEEAYKNKDMVKEAVNASVERLPYGQGGWLIKEIDKVAGPFISASYNAARTFARAAPENPVDFAARVGAIGVPTVGLTIASIMYATEAWRDTPEYDHVRSAVIPFFPDSFNFIDENGDKIYVNVKIPLDPNIATIYNIFRGLTHKMLYEAGATDIEPNYDAIVDSITSSFPMETPLSPTLSAWFTYFRNMEPWRGRKVVPEAFDWPMSGAEGKFDIEVSQAARDIGEPLGVSPPRLEAAFKQIAPQNNEFVWALGKLYDAAFSDVDPRLRRQHWAKIISETPGLKNLMSITVPRAYRTKPRWEEKQKEKFDRMLRNEELDFLAEGYHWKGAGKREDISKFIREFKDYNIRDSLRDKAKFIEDIKDLRHRRSWSQVYHSSPKIKAEEYHGIWKIESSPEERDRLFREKTVIQAAGGFFTNAFWEELNRIRRSEEAVE